LGCEIIWLAVLAVLLITAPHEKRSEGCAADTVAALERFWEELREAYTPRSGTLGSMLLRRVAVVDVALKRLPVQARLSSILVNFC
jgi:hypothetical protein